MQTNLQRWKSTNVLSGINRIWFNRETAQVMPFCNIISPEVSGHEPQSQFLCSDRLRALLAWRSPWFRVLSNDFWSSRRRTFRLLNLLLLTCFIWISLFSLFFLLDLQLMKVKFTLHSKSRWSNESEVSLYKCFRSYFFSRLNTLFHQFRQSILIIFLWPHKHMH